MRNHTNIYRDSNSSKNFNSVRSVSRVDKRSNSTFRSSRHIAGKKISNYAYQNV